MKMIYGAQSDEFDFHHMGFDVVTLSTVLAAHNFCGIKRVGNFNIMQDTSSMKYHGHDISLNIVARKCGREETPPLVQDQSTPYLSHFGE